MKEKYEPYKKKILEMYASGKKVNQIKQELEQEDIEISVYLVRRCIKQAFENGEIITTKPVKIRENDGIIPAEKWMEAIKQRKFDRKDIQRVIRYIEENYEKATTKDILIIVRMFISFHQYVEAKRFVEEIIQFEEMRQIDREKLRQMKEKLDIAQRKQMVLVEYKKGNRNTSDISEKVGLKEILVIQTIRSYEQRKQERERIENYIIKGIKNGYLDEEIVAQLGNISREELLKYKESLKKRGRITAGEEEEGKQKRIRREEVIIDSVRKGYTEEEILEKLDDVEVLVLRMHIQFLKKERRITNKEEKDGKKRRVKREKIIIDSVRKGYTEKQIAEILGDIQMEEVRACIENLKKEKRILKKDEMEGNKARRERERKEQRERIEQQEEKIELMKEYIEKAVKEGKTTEQIQREIQNLGFRSITKTRITLWIKELKQTGQITDEDINRQETTWLEEKQRREKSKQEREAQIKERIQTIIVKAIKEGATEKEIVQQIRNLIPEARNITDGEVKEYRKELRESGILQEDEILGPKEKKEQKEKNTLSRIEDMIIMGSNNGDTIEEIKGLIKENIQVTLTNRKIQLLQKELIVQGKISKERMDERLNMVDNIIRQAVLHGCTLEQTKEKVEQECEYREKITITKIREYIQRMLEEGKITKKDEYFSKINRDRIKNGKEVIECWKDIDRQDIIQMQQKYIHSFKYSEGMEFMDILMELENISMEKTELQSLRTEIEVKKAEQEEKKYKRIGRDVVIETEKEDTPKELQGISI